MTDIKLFSLAVHNFYRLLSAFSRFSYKMAPVGYLCYKRHPLQKTHPRRFSTRLTLPYARQNRNPRVTPYSERLCPSSSHISMVSGAALFLRIVIFVINTRNAPKGV
jgi:hypothetical protein